MRRAHEMPFGAAWADGAARFRLWAPAASGVKLVLGAGDGTREVATASE